MNIARTLLFIGASGVTFFAGILLYNSFRELYYIPECLDISYNDHENIHHTTPYVIGTVQKIEDDAITLRAEFNHFNRWKCPSMKTPYQEILGSGSREYQLKIDGSVEVTDLYQDSRSRYIQFGHTPYSERSADEIIAYLDQEVPSSLSIDSLQYDDRIVAIDRSAVLIRSEFTPELIMISPRDDIQYNLTYQTTAFLILFLLFGLSFEFLYVAISPILSPTLFYIPSILRILGAVMIMLWYLYSHYYG